MFPTTSPVLCTLSIPFIPITKNSYRRLHKKKKITGGGCPFKIPEDKWRLSCYHWWGGINTYPFPGTRSLREWRDLMTASLRQHYVERFCMSESAGGRQWSWQWKWCRLSAQEECKQWIVGFLHRAKKKKGPMGKEPAIKEETRDTEEDKEKEKKSWSKLYHCSSQSRPTPRHIHHW